MNDFPPEIIRKQIEFDLMVDKVLSRRGNKRKEAREDLVLTYSHQLNGARLRNENLKYEALEQMWRSKVSARMDLLDLSLQKISKQLNLLRLELKERTTQAEYDELMERMSSIKATEDPCDIADEVMDSFGELESQKLPPVPELIRQNATPGQN